MEQRINVIVGDDVLFAGLAVDGEHDEMDFVAEETMLERAVKRHNSGIVQTWIRTALLEIEREQREMLVLVFQLGGPAGETDELADLQPMLATVTVESDEWIKK